MSILNRQTIEIPIDKINGIDQMFGRMMKIDIENIPLKFKGAFQKTREQSYQAFKIKGIYQSVEIESIDSDMIKLKNGVIFEAKLMTELFRQSFELGFLVVTLSGYDELDQNEDNMLLKLFLDYWGTAFIECGSNWASQYIAKDLENQEIYTTHSFSPGQNDIPIDMQTQIFRILNPEAIGVTLSDKFMMHPKKSVSGIFGIQTEKDENRVRPCDLCERRETCPTAYV